MEEFILNNLSAGENIYQPKIESINLKGTYILTISTKTEQIAVKLVK
jgi:hypothetical protein